MSSPVFACHALLLWNCKYFQISIHLREGIVKIYISILQIVYNFDSDALNFLYDRILLGNTATWQLGKI